jgi:hypothetical protein
MSTVIYFGTDPVWGPVVIYKKAPNAAAEKDGRKLSMLLA